MAKGDEFGLANQRARQKRDRIPSAISAHYDRGSNRIVIGLKDADGRGFSSKCGFRHGLEAGQKGRRTVGLSRLTLQLSFVSTTWSHRAQSRVAEHTSINPPE